MGIVALFMGGLMMHATVLAENLPINATNPFIWDNDTDGDVFTLEFVMALASNGKINLIGISQSPNPYKNRNDNLQEIIDIARKSGFKNIPDAKSDLGPYFKTALARPEDGSIDSTSPLDTESARMIRDKVLECGTPSKPVVIGSGGAYTTIASAYLLACEQGRGEEFSAKAISIGVAGYINPKNGKYTEREYNVFQDPWARYICLERLRTISVPTPLPKPEETLVGDFIFALPPSPLANYMKKKAHNLVELGHPDWLSCVGDDHAIIPFLFPEEGNFFLSTERIAVSGWKQDTTGRKLNDGAFTSTSKTVFDASSDDIVLMGFNWNFVGKYWKNTLNRAFGRTD